jgi:hypothetical protein
MQSWMAQPGTEPGYGARVVFATLSAAGWMLACFWFAAWLLSTKEPYNASADAIGSWMGVTAALYVAGLFPVFVIGAAVLALIRTEGLRVAFVCGDLAAVLLGCGVRWVPSIPSRVLPDALVRGFSGFGGWWGQYVVLVGFIGICVLLGLWVRTWIVLTRWLGPGRTPGPRLNRRFHGLGG